MVAQYPLHRASFRYKLSTRYLLNSFPIYAKSFVAQHSLNAQAIHYLLSFGLRSALKQAQAFTSNDILKGGEGVDVYQFNGNYGFDTISDSDGQGVIKIDNNPQLNGGKKIAYNVYYNETTQYTYTLSGVVGDQTLVIRKDGDSNQIIVQHWSASKNLNITLDDNITPPSVPAATRTIVGDLKPIDTDPVTSGLQEGVDDLGNVLTSGAEPDRADALNGSDGNDLIQGLGGDDTLMGNAGDDRLEGGTGQDYLDGDAGNNRLYADIQINFIKAINNGSTDKAAGLRADWFQGVNFGISPYNAWFLSQSCNATSIRVCQPVPVALKVSTTLGDNLIVMRALVGASCVPRARRASLVCSVLGNPEKASAALASSLFHSGLSASINSELSLRFINSHLSIISLSKTHHTNTKRGLHKHQSMYALTQQTQGAQAHLTIILPQVLRKQRGFKLKISRPLKRQTTQFDIECIFSEVETNFHASYCMYKVIGSQVANDNEWRVAA